MKIRLSIEEKLRKLIANVCQILREVYHQNLVLRRDILISTKTTSFVRAAEIS